MFRPFLKYLMYVPPEVPPLVPDEPDVNLMFLNFLFLKYLMYVPDCSACS
jgi:hypothetical protein